MGGSGEGQNITHSQKKMADESLLAFRDRFRIPLDDKAVLACEFYHRRGQPRSYLSWERRAALGRQSAGTARRCAAARVAGSVYF